MPTFIFYKNGKKVRRGWKEERECGYFRWAISCGIPVSDHGHTLHVHCSLLMTFLNSSLPIFKIDDFCGANEAKLREKVKQLK